MQTPSPAVRRIPTKVLHLTGETPEVIMEGKRVPAKLLSLTGETAPVLTDRGMKPKLVSLTGEALGEVQQALAGNATNTGGNASHNANNIFTAREQPTKKLFPKTASGKYL
jgi:hypothetical protein